MDIVKNVLNVLPVHWICNDIVSADAQMRDSKRPYIRSPGWCILEDCTE
jgi:hypothetical protein